MSAKFSLLAVAASVLLVVVVADRRNRGSHQRIHERHIIVPGMKGCACAEAMMKMHAADATSGQAKNVFKQCAESVGIPEHEREGGSSSSEEGDSAESGGEHGKPRGRCGKLVLDYSPENVTQECFEQTNTIYRMHQMAMKFLANLGDKRAPLVACLGKGLNYLRVENDRVVGINKETFENLARTYFSEAARQEALNQVDQCYETYGRAFPENESVDVSFDNFYECLLLKCL